MKPMRAGIIGCGNISPAYVRNLQGQFSHLVEVAACADLDSERAAKRAAEFGIAKPCSVDALLADHDIDLVIDLTNPVAHCEVTTAALNAGKHVFVEKPLALTREDGQRMVALASSKGLALAGAPDIFLGAGLQACRRVIDAGEIGEPSAAQALISMNGHRERYLKVYGGPLLDMGPYYVTALVTLLGPVKRVGGLALAFARQSSGGAPADWEKLPSNYAAVLEFDGGRTAVLTATAEGAGYLPRLEILGTAATLKANDPNGYAGRVAIRTAKGEEREVPAEGFARDGRGLGVAEMAWAIGHGREPRASGRLMLHVLDVMMAVGESSRSGGLVTIASTVERPAPFDLQTLAA